MYGGHDCQCVHGRDAGPEAAGHRKMRAAPPPSLLHLKNGMEMNIVALEIVTKIEMMWYKKSRHLELTEKE